MIRHQSVIAASPDPASQAWRARRARQNAELDHASAHSDDFSIPPPELQQRATRTTHRPLKLHRWPKHGRPAIYLDALGSPGATIRIKPLGASYMHRSTR